MTTIERDLEEAHYLNSIEIEPEDKKKPWKRIAIILGSLFMVGLMLSFIFVQYPIVGILLGQIQSGRVVGNAVEASRLRVIFTGDTLLQAYESWDKYPQVESVLCFSGERIGNDVIVSSGYEPEIIFQSFDRVQYVGCDQDTLVYFHTHPWKRCIASEQDVSNLRSRNERNPDAIMLIMCDRDRFSVYD